MTASDAGTRTDQSDGPARTADCTKRLERKLATLGDPFLSTARSGLPSRYVHSLQSSIIQACSALGNVIENA